MTMEQGQEPIEANQTEEIQDSEQEQPTAIDGLAEEMANLMAPDETPANEEDVDGEGQQGAAKEKGQEGAQEEDQPQKIKVGDKEFTPKELEDGLLMQADYTRKTQEIAEHKKAIEPWVGLIQAIQSDPNLANHIRQYGQQAQAANQLEEPEDPVEAIEFRAVQRAKEELRREMGMQQQQIAGMQAQQTLEAAKASFQRDPMYNEVHSAIVEQVKSLPPAQAQAVYRQLDVDPSAYAEAFNLHKERLLANRANSPTGNPPEGREVQRTTKAPILEGAGKNLPTNEQRASRAAELKEKRKRLNNGEMDTGEIMDYMETSGALDKVFAVLNLA